MALRKRRGDINPGEEAMPATELTGAEAGTRQERENHGGGARRQVATTGTNTSSPASQRSGADQNGSPRSSSSASPSLHQPFGRATSAATAIAFFLLGLCTTWLQESWDGGQFTRRLLGKSPPGSPFEQKRRKGTRDHPEHPCSRSDSESGILREFLHDRREPGLHLVCVRDARVTFFPGAHLGGGKTVEVRVESDSSERGNQLELLGVELLESYLDLKDNAKDRFLSWVAFSTEGERLFDADSFDEQLLRDHGLIVVLEGGVWRWPGVRVGFQRRIELSEENRTLTLETLSLSPLVLASAGFLSESECTEIQRLAEPIVRYSEVSLMDKDAGRPSSDFRTSSSAFLTRASASPLLRSLNDRTAAFLRIPRTHQEHLQVLRYFPGEKYDQHHDYFDPELYQNDLATLTLTRHGKRNRFATFFWYLSNVASGGETSFPKVEGRSPLSLLDCAGTDSLLVRPELGKVVLFYSMTAAGELDPLSVHAACPVGPGGDVKWAANKWVWNAPMTYIQ